MGTRRTSPATGGRGSNQYRSTGASATATSRSSVGAEVAAAAFAPGGLQTWASWGATDDEIATWHPYLTPTQAAWYISYGIDDPEDALRFHEQWTAHLDRVGTVHPPTSSQLWFVHYHLRTWSVGIPWSEVPDWQSASTEAAYPIRTRVAQAWHRSGWTPGDASEWIRSGFASPSERDFWQDRFPGDDLARLASRRASAWKQHLTHLTDVDPAVLSLGGLVDPSELRAWDSPVIQSTFKAPDIAHLHASGVSADWAAAAAPAFERWGGIHRQGEVVARLHRESGGGVPGDAVAAMEEAWKGSRPGRKYSPVSILPWYSEGLTVPQTKRWSRVWNDAAHDGAEAAGFWIRANVPPEEARRWEPRGDRFATAAARPIMNMVRARGGDRNSEALEYL